MSRYRLTGKDPELLKIAEQGGNESLRSNALQALLNAGGAKLVDGAIAKQDTTSIGLINVLGMVEDIKNKDILQRVVVDKRYNLTVRLDAINAMGRDWTGEDRLLSLAKDKKLPADLRDSTAMILAHSNRQQIKDQAAVILPAVNAGGGNTIAPVKQLLAMPSDAAAGGKVFATFCSSCHQVNNVGIDFGPKLSEIGSKLSKEALYTAVMQPSAGISFGYEGYLFTFRNGSHLLGYISSQTTDEITIKMIGGQSEKHKRSEITEKKEYGRSLMTEGLPQAMGQQQFANLLAYLASLKKKG